MEYAIMGLTFGLCLFILPLWAYRRGLKDGLALNQGKPIEPIQNPVKTVMQYVETRAEKKETKEANNALQEGFNNLMSYDGSDQMKVGEK
jgi:hypothetical protein